MPIQTSAHNSFFLSFFLYYKGHISRLQQYPYFNSAFQSLTTSLFTSAMLLAEYGVQVSFPLGWTQFPPIDYSILFPCTLLTTHIDNANKIYVTQNQREFSKSLVYIHQINASGTHTIYQFKTFLCLFAQKALLGRVKLALKFVTSLRDYNVCLQAGSLS